MTKIIPAIDIIDGKCVRLTQGDYEKRQDYHDDPLEMAKTFAHAGATHLHLVDLDGAKKGTVVNWKVLERITAKTGLSVDFGGGVKTMADIDRILDSGARQVTIGTLAARDPDRMEAFIERYGADKFIIGADSRKGKIVVSGWIEESTLKLYDFVANYHLQGIRNFLCTDIERDGMLGGPATDLYREIMARHPDINLIASGGVSNMEDVKALNEAGIPAVVVGKALYEERITMAELKHWNHAH